MRTQLSDVGIVGKQGTYTTCVENLKKTLRERKVLGNNPKDGNIPQRNLKRRRTKLWTSHHQWGITKLQWNLKHGGGNPQDPTESWNHQVQVDLFPDDGDISGNKLIHSSSNSDSNKDNAKMDVGNQLALVSL